MANDPYWKPILAVGLAIAGGIAAGFGAPRVRIVLSDGTEVWVASASVVAVEDDSFGRERSGTVVRTDGGETYHSGQPTDEVLSLVPGLFPLRRGRARGGDSAVHVRPSSIRSATRSHLRVVGSESSGSVLSLAGGHRVVVRDDLATVRDLVGRG